MCQESGGNEEYQYTKWEDGQIITKTCLFKYIENFTTKKKEDFQLKKILIFSKFLLKT